jgi:hypothetical protein
MPTLCPKKNTKFKQFFEGKSRFPPLKTTVSRQKTAFFPLKMGHFTSTFSWLNSRFGSSDKRVMAALKHEFAEILRGFLEGEPPAEAQPTHSAPSTTPVFFDWNLPSTAPTGRVSVAKVYPQAKKRAAPVPAPPPPPKPVFSLKIEVLTAAEQRAARQFFGTAGRPLPKILTETEVKSVFRQLAKTHHPDRHITGTSRQRQEGALLFSQSNRAYRMLVKALKTRGTPS